MCCDRILLISFILLVLLILLICLSCLSCSSCDVFSLVEFRFAPALTETSFAAYANGKGGKS